MTAPASPPRVPRDIRAIIHRIERATVAALGHDGAARLLVAVSGGADSSAALIALAERAARHGWHVEAAHLDHGIAAPQVRAGFRDAARALAQTFGLPLHTGCADLDPGGPGLEAAARAARYAYLAGCARRVGADAIVTGHTANDQVETVLLHLLRGSGLDGLTGMRPRAPLPIDDSAAPPLVRPLLDVTRVETEAVCRAFGIPFALDPANRNPAFLRNRVRRELLPLMRELSPTVDSAIGRLAAAARLDRDALDAVAAQALTELAARSTETTPAGQETQVSRAALQGYPVGLQRRLLRAWAEQAGAGPLSAERTDALQRLVERGGGTVELAGGVSASASGDRLTLRRALGGP